MSTASIENSARYRVPALEKGLDILELLSAESEGLTQSQIAQRLNRSPDELFRVVVSLERRGYIHRLRPEDTYHLTSRLFVMANKHPPTQRLMDAALPVMRKLSRETIQSCHLSLPTPEGMLVVCQVDAPVSLGFAVRRGTLLDVKTSSTGMVYRAFAEDAGRHQTEHRLQQIRQDGFLKKDSVAVGGVTDVCAPVLDHREVATAVLCVPYVTFLTESVSVDRVLNAVLQAARQVSEIQGWMKTEETNLPHP